ncbi:hypothetical protein [Clostridium estertheticum]|uniref:hypothetical protein n=1 Tax=Clostridium estertheticum TaxID=238834 RepID=UPI001CF2BF51|nr:hypothetical protein [Clostridium estertheticum]MCB2361958.1 hypothetical protein [Clostridium estertheticum]
MKIETQFSKLKEQKEREYGESLTLEKISSKTGVNASVLKLMQSSHFKDISSVAIGDIVSVCEYFETGIHNFITIENILQANGKDKNGNIASPNSPSKCNTGERFKEALNNSDYYNTYANVPDLIDSFATLIDENPGLVLAGVVKNCNIKLTSGDVLIRFVAQSNQKGEEQICIKNVLYGRAINMDNKHFYKKIYQKYMDELKKDTVDTAKDVSKLISLAKEYI